MTAPETPDELRARLIKGRRLYDAWRDATPSISALSMLAATEWHDWLKVNISDLLDGVVVIDALLARLTAAERQVVDWNRIANEESARGDDLAARLTAAEADRPCVSCDRTAVIDGWCLPCAAGEELHLTEDERERMRDLIADFFTDEDGVPSYQAVDALWLTLYRAGFDIMRRPVAGEALALRERPQ